MWLIVKFLIGTVLLVVGAECLVRGAAAIAQRLKIPRHVIGLTLVALGTSAPELFVNVLAAWNGNSDFALSNISGSNLANLAVGFGLCAVLASAVVRREDFFSDLLLVWVTPLVVLVILRWRADGALPLLAVLPLSGLLAWYLWSLFHRRREDAELEGVIGGPGIRHGSTYFLLGVAALYFGGQLVLHSAIEVAQLLEVNEDVIALTIVAFGTSIPDITASIVAARKGEHGIAAGNLLGSNISNITVVLNATLLVTGEKLVASPIICADYLAVVMLSVFVFVVVMRAERVPKVCGWLMIAAYVTYLIARVAV